MARKIRRSTNVRKGPKLAAYQLVLRPLLTEKCVHQMERRNTYGFEVHPTATKPQIRQAIEILFDVEVERVRTVNGKPKKRRFKNKLGTTKAMKKAYVQLNEEHRIAMF